VRDAPGQPSWSTPAACAACARRVCPEDFAVQDLCLQARRRMVRRGKMPPSAHEFALQDMRFSLSERFASRRHAPGRSEAPCFLPGCQLWCLLPGQVRRVYAHLLEVFADGVGLMLGCCGAPPSGPVRKTSSAPCATGSWKIGKRWGSPNSLSPAPPVFACSRAPAQVPTTSLWQLMEKPISRLPPQQPLDWCWRSTTRAPRGPTQPSKMRSAGS